jgi:hypothetical protein
MTIVLLLNVKAVIIRLMFPLLLRLLHLGRDHNQGLNQELEHSLDQAHSLELVRELVLVLTLVHLTKKEAVESLKDQKAECLEEEPLEAVLLLLLNLRV